MTDLQKFNITKNFVLQISVMRDADNVGFVEQKHGNESNQKTNTGTDADEKTVPFEFVVSESLCLQTE